MNVAGIGITAEIPDINSVSTAADGVDSVQARADEAATHFEGVFMSMMLKEMRATLSEGLFSGEGSDTLGALFDMHMGQHLAEQGSIGIRDMVAAHYQRNSQQQTDSKEA